MAVSDPDGNSSDDDDDDNDDDKSNTHNNNTNDEEKEVDELLGEIVTETVTGTGIDAVGGGGKYNVDDELLLQQRQQSSSSSYSGFESLVEMAEVRDTMKRRISEMENEILRSKKQGGMELEEGEGEEREEGVEGGDDENDHASTMEDSNISQGMDNADDDGDSTSSSITSYHLAGTDVAREDGILKRQRKYKRTLQRASSGGSDGGGRGGATRQGMFGVGKLHL